MHVCLCTTHARTQCHTFENGVSGGCKLPCSYWKLSPGPFRERPASPPALWLHLRYDRGKEQAWFSLSLRARVSRAHVTHLLQILPTDSHHAGSLRKRCSGDCQGRGLPSGMPTGKGSHVLWVLRHPSEAALREGSTQRIPGKDM